MRHMWGQKADQSLPRSPLYIASICLFVSFKELNLCIAYSCKETALAWIWKIVILNFSSSLQQEAAPKVDTPFFDMVEKSIFSKNARRCIACTITAGINIPAKGHKGLCTEAMIYAGKKPTFLRELKHLEGLYDASVHDSMTREQALEVLSSAYEIAK